MRVLSAVSRPSGACVGAPVAFLAKTGGREGTAVLGTLGINTVACQPHREQEAEASLVVLVRELVLRGGLLGDGLQARSALGIGARGADGLSAFTQLTGESSIVDLLHVLQDFAPGVFQ